MNSVNQDVQFAEIFSDNTVISLELVVEGEVLSPRQVLTAAPWALAAGRGAQGSDLPDCDSGEVLMWDGTGWACGRSDQADAATVAASSISNEHVAADAGIDQSKIDGLVAALNTRAPIRSDGWVVVDGVLIDSARVRAHEGNRATCQDSQLGRMYLQRDGSDADLTVCAKRGDSYEYVNATGDIDAAQVRSGVLDIARIPRLTANKITGTLSDDQIPNLSADKITTGTFATDRLPLIPADKLRLLPIDKVSQLQTELDKRPTLKQYTNAAGDPGHLSITGLYQGNGLLLNHRTSDPDCDVQNRGRIFYYENSDWAGLKLCRKHGTQYHWDKIDIEGH